MIQLILSKNCSIQYLLIFTGIALIVTNGVELGVKLIETVETLMLLVSFKLAWVLFLSSSTLYHAVWGLLYYSMWG